VFVTCRSLGSFGCRISVIVGGDFYSRHFSGSVGDSATTCRDSAQTREWADHSVKHVRRLTPFAGRGLRLGGSCTSGVRSVHSPGFVVEGRRHPRPWLGRRIPSLAQYARQSGAFDRGDGRSTPESGLPARGEQSFAGESLDEGRRGDEVVVMEDRMEESVPERGDHGDPERDGRNMKENRHGYPGYPTNQEVSGSLV
jgi:hypothetical protein